jgi:hypothetical protein
MEALKHLKYNERINENIAEFLIKKHPTEFPRAEKISLKLRITSCLSKKKTLFVKTKIIGLKGNVCVWNIKVNFLYS